MDDVFAHSLKCRSDSGEGICRAADEEDELAAFGLDAAAGDGCVEEFEAASLRQLSEFGDPVRTGGAGFNQDCSSFGCGECAMGACPGCTRGVVIGEHGEDELRSSGGLGRGTCDACSLCGEGFGCGGGAVVNGEREASFEEIGGHTFAHRSKSKQCDRYLFHEVSFGNELRERLNANRLFRLYLFVDRVAKRAAKTLEANPCNVSFNEYDVVSERERVGPVEVDVDAAGLTVACELEVMMFQVGQAVTHVLLSAGDLFVPEGCARALDAYVTGDVGEGCSQHKFGAQAADAELGAREVEVITSLEFVIGELIALSDTDAKWSAIGRNDVDAGELGLFAAVFSVRGNLKRLEGAAENGAIAFVEPLRSNTDLAISRTASLQSPLEHAHGVGENFLLLWFGFLIRKMHGLTLSGAPEVSEAGAGDEQTRRLSGNVYRCQQMPWGTASVNLVVGDAFASGASASLLDHGLRVLQALLCELIDGRDTGEAAKVRLFDERDAAGGAVSNLNEMYRHNGLLIRSR
jgi:hypothetical protein